MRKRGAPGPQWAGQCHEAIIDVHNNVVLRRRNDTALPLGVHGMLRRKKGYPVPAAVIAILGIGLTLPCAAADSGQQSVEELRDTVINLLQALVEQGVISQEKAQELVRRAQEKATAEVAAREQQAAKQKLEDEGAIRVPYVPDIVKQEISKQVAEQVRPEVTADVVKEAHDQGWGVPGALPDWVRHTRVTGNVTLRGQSDLYGNQNGTGCPPGTIYDNCTLLNYQAINTAGGISKAGVDAFLNVTQDRERMRFRAWLGAVSDLTDSITTGVRISSGALNDPGSDAPTIGGEFARYTVGFDQFYIRWDGRTSTRFDYLTAMAGKFDNPFYHPTEAVWQRDVTLEGGALTGRFGIGDGSPDQSYLWLSSGGFPVQEIPLVSQSDKWLVAGQLGASVRVADDQRLTLAGAYYDFIRIEGVRNTLESTLTNYTAPSFIRFGNSVFDISNTADTSVNLFALASRFRVVDVAGGYWLPIGSHALSLDAEASRNVGFNRTEILNRTGLDIAPRTRAYVAQLAFGTPTEPGTWTPPLERAGAWRVLFGYRYSQRDSMVDSLTDADFHEGGTNAEGFFIWGEYGFAHNVWTRLRYLSGREIDGPLYRVNVIQWDLTSIF